MQDIIESTNQVETLFSSSTVKVGRPRSKTEALGEISVRVSAALLSAFPECCEKLRLDLREALVNTVVPHSELYIVSPEEVDCKCVRWYRRNNQLKWTEEEFEVVIVEATLLYQEIFNCTNTDVLEESLIAFFNNILLKSTSKRQFVAFVGGKSVDEKINRQFKQAIRRQITVETAGEGGSSQHKLGRTWQSLKDVIFTAAMIAGRIHAVFLDESCNSSLQMEMSKYLFELTRNISWRPYIQGNIENAALFSVCLDAGGRSGQTLKETYSLMLQEISHVSRPVADAIVQAYPTLNDLFRACNTVDFLSAIPITRNNGQTRCIGPALSAKLYRIFRSLDPSMLIRE